MRIYITNAQVPELAPFPTAARRVLRRSAFQCMFAIQPWLRWLPNGLCFVGTLIALFTFTKLPWTLFHSWRNPFLVSMISLSYVLLLACLGGFIGEQFLIHHSRIYLRRLISQVIHETYPTA